MLIYADKLEFQVHIHHGVTQTYLVSFVFAIHFAFGAECVDFLGGDIDVLIFTLEPPLSALICLWGPDDPVSNWIALRVPLTTELMFSATKPEVVALI